MHRTLVVIVSALGLVACATDSNRRGPDATGPRSTNVGDAATRPAVQNLARVAPDTLWRVAQDVLKPYQVREADRTAGTLMTRTFFWKGEEVPRYCFIEFAMRETDPVHRTWRFAVWAYRVERKFSGEAFDGGDMGDLHVVGIYDDLQKEIAREILTRYLTQSSHR